jgi:hypothetical protein
MKITDSVFIPHQLLQRSGTCWRISEVSERFKRNVGEAIEMPDVMVQWWCWNDGGTHQQTLYMASIECVIWAWIHRGLILLFCLGPIVLFVALGCMSCDVLSLANWSKRGIRRSCCLDSIEDESSLHYSAWVSAASRSKTWRTLLLTIQLMKVVWLGIGSTPCC